MSFEEEVLRLGKSNTSFLLGFDEECDEAARLCISADLCYLEILDFTREDFIRFGEAMIAFANEHPNILKDQNDLAELHGERN